MTAKVELKIIGAEGEEVSIIIKEKEITLNGVRYIPDYTQPNKVSIYLMKDNHSSIKIKGTTPKQVLTNIKKTKLANPEADIGIIFLMHEKKEINRFHIDVSKMEEISDILHKQEIQSLLIFN